MQNRHVALVLALLVALIAPAMANSFKTEKIKVPTVQCEMCKAKIESGLKKVKGVKSVDVNVDDKVATVVFDEKVTSVAGIEKAIANVGYDANDTKANPKSQSKLSSCCRPGAHEN